MWIITTELGDLNIELVSDRVPKGEAECGSVCARTAHVYVGMISCISTTYIRVVSIASRCSCIGCGSSVCSLYRHPIRSTLSTGSLISIRVGRGPRWDWAIKDETLVVEPHTTNIIGTLPDSVLQGPSSGIVTGVVRVDYIGAVLTDRGTSS